MDSIRETILQGILNNFPDVEITDILELDLGVEGVLADSLAEYDLVLCDLTTSNPNVLYYTGQAEALGKPVIYFQSSESVPPLALRRKRILLYSDVSITEEFQQELHKLITSVGNDPSVLLEPVSKDNRPKAFISYSHHDATYLERLMVHLKPLTRKGLLDVWVDTEIKVGDKWQMEIQSALENANIAILLVSADFMASDFIVDNELPPLLSKAEVTGTRILPVILAPCRFSRDKSLSRFQSVNAPEYPLSSMNHDEREAIYDQLTSEIEKTIN